MRKVIMLVALLAFSPGVFGQFRFPPGDIHRHQNIDYSGSPQFSSAMTLTLNDTLGMLTGSNTFVYGTTNTAMDNTGNYVQQDQYFFGPGAQSGDPTPWDQLPYGQLTTPDGVTFYLSVWDANGDVWGNGADGQYATLILDPVTGWSWGLDQNGNQSNLVDISNPGAVDDLTANGGGMSAGVLLSIPDALDPNGVGIGVLGTASGWILTICAIGVSLLVCVVVYRLITGKVFAFGASS